MKRFNYLPLLQLFNAQQPTLFVTVSGWEQAHPDMV